MSRVEFDGPDRRHLNRKQMAAWLGLKVIRFRVMVARGILPGPVQPGGYWTARDAALCAALLECGRLKVNKAELLEIRAERKRAGEERTRRRKRQSQKKSPGEKES